MKLLKKKKIIKLLFCIIFIGIILLLMTTKSNATSVGEAIVGGIGVAVDGIVGVIFYFFKIPLMILGWLFMRIIGFAINGLDGAWSGIPLDKVLFNQIPILQINFFDTVSSGNTTVDQIRGQVAVWYVAIRNLSAVILAIMALYVGIRMAISSVAEEKARYKRMLTDWLVSILLLFVLHYIMALIININDGIVAIIASASKGTTGAGLTIMDELLVDSLNPLTGFTTQIAYLGIYFMLAFMSFIFFATYVKRMITIAFLIMISPLITITYSIDRMGDGKSQALNTWFKNFVYNVLLQPFQCIIYLALVETSIQTISRADLTSCIVAIMMIFFMYQAEDIIKDIFHFEGKSVANTIAQAALIGTTIGMISKGVSTAGKVKGYASKNATDDKQKKQPETKDNKEEMESKEAKEQTDKKEKDKEKTDIPPSNDYQAEPEPSFNDSKEKTTPLDIAEKILTATPAREIGKLPLAIALGAAGLATGNLSNALTGFTAGRKAIESGFNSYDDKMNLYKFNKEYQSQRQNIYQDKDDNWVRDHSKDLLNGDVEVKDYEKDYYDMLLREKDRYIDSGYSNDDAITQIEQNIAGIQAGKIGSKPKFIGHIPREMFNRFK